MGISDQDTRKKLAQAAATTSENAVQLAEHPVAKALRYKLGSDRARLKKIQSMQHKAEVKTEILPEYLPYLEGVLAANSGEPDEIVSQLLVWCFDAGSMDLFESIARYVLANDLSMPDGFDRPTITWIAESVAKNTLEALADEQDLSPSWFGFVIWLESTTANRDIHDQVRAKLCRACGELLEVEDPETALKHYQSAISLDKHIRIKKRIKALEQTIASAETASPSPQGQATDGAGQKGDSLSPSVPDSAPAALPERG